MYFVSKISIRARTLVFWLRAFRNVHDPALTFEVCLLCIVNWKQLPWYVEMCAYFNCVPQADISSNCAIEMPEWTLPKSVRDFETSFDMKSSAQLVTDSCTKSIPEVMFKASPPPAPPPPATFSGFVFYDMVRSKFYMQVEVQRRKHCSVVQPVRPPFFTYFLGFNCSQTTNSDVQPEETGYTASSTSASQRQWDLYTIKGAFATVLTLHTQVCQMLIVPMIWAVHISFLHVISPQ